MDSQVFQVDTKGICLLCISDSGLSGYSGSEAGPPNSVSATGFKMFLRYLKIDFMDLGHFSSSFRPHLNGPDSIDVSVILCQRCSLVTGQFLQLFQQFEKIRLNLDNCAQKLYGAIREGQEDENRIREYRKRLRTPGTSHISPKDALNASIAERLRDKTLEKCALRLASSTPKILTTKIYLPPPLKFRPTPATTSDRVIEERSCNNPIFTKVEQVSSDVDDNTLDLHYEEEVEESDDVASPLPFLTEEPALEEKSQSSFIIEGDQLISQPLPPKLGIANDVISVKVRTSLPPEQANSSTCISGDVVVSHSNANTGLLRPACEPKVKLFVLPIYVRPGPPMVAGSPAQSSNHLEPSQNEDQDIQVLDSDSINTDGVLDLDFERDSDNEIPTNDPLELEERPEILQAPLPTPAFKPIKLPNGKFKCPYCGKILRSRATIGQHLREVHVRKKFFRCAQCSNMFARKGGLDKHVRVIHSLKLDSEEAAAPIPSSPSVLPNGKVKCPQCRKIFASWFTFLQHRREMHSAFKKSFQCQHCHRTFPRKRALVGHMLNLHPFLKFRERCPVGTTETEFVTVVNSLGDQMREGFKMNHRLPQKSTTDLYCTFCEKAVPLSVYTHLREHIFCFHMDQVISNLERTKHKDNWSNPNTNVQCVGYSSDTTTPTRASLVFKIDHEDVE